MWVGLWVVLVGGWDSSQFPASGCYVYHYIFFSVFLFLDETESYCVVPARLVVTLASDLLPLSSLPPDAVFPYSELLLLLCVKWMWAWVQFQGQLFRSLFFVGSGNQTQATRLAKQVLLPAEPPYLPLFVFKLCVSLCTWVQGLVEARRGRWIPWSCSYRWLWATPHGLGTERRSFTSAASAWNCWVISPLIAPLYPSSRHTQKLEDNCKWRFLSCPPGPNKHSEA